MPVFTYRGTNRTGTTVTGEQLREQERSLVNSCASSRLKSQDSEKGKDSLCPPLAPEWIPRNSPSHAAVSGMIDAGLPLVQCLKSWPASRKTRCFRRC